MTGKSIIMTEQDIRKLLENLGSKVSMLAEENRVCKNRDDAGQQLITLLGGYIAEMIGLKYINQLMIHLLKSLC